MTKNRLIELLKSDTAVFVYVLILVMVGVFYGHVKSQNFIHTILQKPKITTGFINGTHLEKNGFIVEYSFTADGKDFSSYMSRSMFTKIRYFLYNGRSFPVIYSIANPEKSNMLILPENFEDFNVPFPDSLSWELKYLDKF